MSDDTPRFGGAEYEIGKLHGRVCALEDRVSKQESILSAIDGKIDTVLLTLATATGGDARVSSMMKYTIAIVTALGSLGGIFAAAFHFLNGAH